MSLIKKMNGAETITMIIIDNFVFFLYKFVVVCCTDPCTMIAKDLYLKIISLYCDGATPYAISNELKINYRTVKRYTDAHDAIVAQITKSLYSCIFAKTEQNDESLQKFA